MVVKCRVGKTRESYSKRALPLFEIRVTCQGKTKVLNLEGLYGMCLLATPIYPQEHYLESAFVRQPCKSGSYTARLS